jgi:ethanolamine kinase
MLRFLLLFEEMAVPRVAESVAKTLALWHRMEVPGEPSPRLFRTLKKWLEGLPRHYDNAALQAQWTASGITHDWLQKQLVLLEYKIVAALESPVVFCHNDLLSGNIIDSGSEVSFIDYEYGAQNYRGFDIGNHFCEYAGFECEFEQYYPSKPTQMRFLSAYLTAVKEGTHPTDLELEQLYLEVNLFALTSHFFWGLWALIQASLSDIQFDYMGYAIKRFQRYRDTKQHWFNLLEQNS